MGQKKGSATKKQTKQAITVASRKGINQVAEPQAMYAHPGKDRVLEFMGLTLKRHLPKVNDDAYFIEVIRKGIAKKVLDQLMIKLDLTEEEMASILHVSKRTLQRRLPQETFSPEQSERLIELARLFTRGEEVMGDKESFKEWMNKKVWTLGDRRPKEFLDTSIGINILMDELGRIQFGVYS